MKETKDYRYAKVSPTYLQYVQRCAEHARREGAANAQEWEEWAREVERKFQEQEQEQS